MHDGEAAKESQGGGSEEEPVRILLEKLNLRDRDGEEVVGAQVGIDRRNE